MTVQERIRRNREMESRIAAREAAEAPTKAAAAKRKFARSVVGIIFSLPADMQRTAAAIAIRAIRPDRSNEFADSVRPFRPDLAKIMEIRKPNTCSVCGDANCDEPGCRSDAAFDR